MRVMSQSGWRKSSRCEQTNCVEVAWREGGMVAVRNNTEPAVHLTFASSSWQALLADLRDGKLDG